MFRRRRALSSGIRLRRVNRARRVYTQQPHQQSSTSWFFVVDDCERLHPSTFVHQRICREPENRRGYRRTRETRIIKEKGRSNFSNGERDGWRDQTFDREGTLKWSRAERVGTLPSASIWTPGSCCTMRQILLVKFY